MLRATPDAVCGTIIQHGSDFEKPLAGVSVRKKCK